MQTTQIEIPTYIADSEPECDYSRRNRLTLLEGDGLRVVMGEPDDVDAPDVLIERVDNTWRIVVHPNAGDPLCIVEIGKGHAVVEDDMGQLLLQRTLL